MNWKEKYNFVGPMITKGGLAYRRNERKILAKEMRLKLENKFKLNEWAKSIKIRDGYTCTRCGSKKYLHAHHIKSRAEYPSLMYCISNGITLCVDCHSTEHGRGIPNGVIYLEMHHPHNKKVL